MGIMGNTESKWNNSIRREQLEGVVFTGTGPEIVTVPT